MKLSDMGYNAMYCVLYVQDGKIMKTFDVDRMDKILQTLPSSHHVVVYNPDSELKREILTSMGEGFDGEKVELDGVTTLRLIEKLTDIDLGLDSGELTMEQALEIVNNPNNMLVAVNQVVNNIFMSILSEQFETMNTISQLPEPVKINLLDEIVNKEQREQEQLKQAEINELLKQQQELEAKVKALRGE
jgi:hypothetical protein